jgi:hypothetical protein
VISLKKDEAEEIISYLEMAFKKAVTDQLPVSQDSIKAIIKLLRKRLKNK